MNIVNLPRPCFPLTCRFLAKDTHIDDGALVTRNNQAVSTTTNELEATVGALAFLPDEARKHVKSITFRGDGSDGEEVVYEKLVGSIVVHPKKSVILTTTEGDSLKWSLADNKTLVKITLANGDSWMLDSGCEKCTILNLKENDEIVDALDEYHVTIGAVLHERGRVLHNRSVVPKHILTRRPIQHVRSLIVSSLTFRVPKGRLNHVSKLK